MNSEGRQICSHSVQDVNMTNCSMTPDEYDKLESQTEHMDRFVFRKKTKNCTLPELKQMPDSAQLL